MSPFLGAVAGYPIPIFAVALDIGLLCGVVVAMRLARRRGLPVSGALDAVLLALVSALAGSRAWYVVEHWVDYASSPLAMLAVWEGGLALPGGVLAAAVALPFAARVTRIAMSSLADSGAIGAALGQSIGRLGCIPAGCAAGKPVEELWDGVPAVMLPDATGNVTMRFPSQPLESAADLLLAAVLWIVWRAGARPGTIGWLYLVGYATIRLAAEPFRA